MPLLFCSPFSRHRRSSVQRVAARRPSLVVISDVLGWSRWRQRWIDLFVDFCRAIWRNEDSVKNQKAGEEALKVASPVVSEASKKAQEAMQSSGINADPVMTAAKTLADAAQQTTKVIEGAKPIASSAVQTISTSEPTVIVATAGALFLTYLALPSIWSAISFNLRGYQDIRSEKDKDKTGVPRLPSSSKNRLIAIPQEDYSPTIVILDSYADSTEIVARTLTSIGFKNCWVISDGSSGRNGWLQSRLGTDSYDFSFVEYNFPNVIPRPFDKTYHQLQPVNITYNMKIPASFRHKVQNVR
ncbi:hypothetical protein MLD38_026203 [Melastoma candidum]|uniref:Uncharacterized protein n=1 Tax=Melastoma candidum TaxID=119954 RepID=A0ACB9P1C6_9MYRT|nr:hypothetical protein MLD38_026203 [Melastoma candidum]